MGEWPKGMLVSFQWNCCGQKGSSNAGLGRDTSPPAADVETVGLASEGDQLLNAGFSTEVVETTLNSKYPKHLQGN